MKVEVTICNAETNEILDRLYVIGDEGQTAITIQHAITRVLEDNFETEDAT